ncbi:tryptophan synthase subunit alpha [Flexivirga meconopsidis]|uniref:tryptophan synthase subunit alpha n=1 Tax=Flexivirga meconopsidis TaxID=2977121 RepID=UPI00223F305B|nr:tryptophan synthase subunit alpha [Flexivirga meconopsidis]
MERLAKTFAATAERSETALVAYLTCGYPAGAEMAGLITSVADAGADIVELGVPFSDPMGDGPVIQHTAAHALAAGMTLPGVIETVREVRENGVDTPIVLMGYSNPFLRYGLTTLYADVAAAGADGLVVPDLPAYEAGDWIKCATESDLAQVFFAAPTSRPERLERTVAASSGFLYALATNGVTGSRAELNPAIGQYLDGVAAIAGTLPVCVGFGISRPEHVRSLHGRAAGVIVGSALMQRLDDARTASAREDMASGFIRELKGACR